MSYYNDDYWLIDREDIRQHMDDDMVGYIDGEGDL